jgi:hypothetical protein
MASIATIDMTSTRVDFLLEPLGVEGQVARWTSNSAAVPVNAQNTVSLSVKRSTEVNGVSKVKVTVTTPTTKVVDGEVVLSKTPRFVGEFYLPNPTTKAERTDLLYLVSNLLGTEQIGESILDVMNVYG